LMPFTVDFHDEVNCVSCEVCDVTSDGNLTAKCDAVRCGRELGIRRLSRQGCHRDRRSAVCVTSPKCRRSGSASE
jgi:hypothetical protein